MNGKRRKDAESNGKKHDDRPYFHNLYNRE